MCRTEGCGKQSAQRLINIVNVKNRKYRTEGCSKQPSFGVASTKTLEYCTQHAPDEKISAKKRKCKTEGSGKELSFGVAGTKTAEYCTQHAPDGMINVRYKNMQY